MPCLLQSNLPLVIPAPICRCAYYSCCTYYSYYTRSCCLAPTLMLYTYISAESRGRGVSTSSGTGMEL